MAITPIKIRLRKDSRQITLEYEDETAFDLPFEYLRVYSPSAEVKGHGPGQGVLQTGKENVRVTEVEPIGHYALRLIFDDGHDTAFIPGNTCTSWAPNNPRNGRTIWLVSKPRVTNGLNLPAEIDDCPLCTRRRPFG